MLYYIHMLIHICIYKTMYKLMHMYIYISKKTATSTKTTRFL